MDLSDPNVVLQIFRKRNLYRGSGLVRIHKMHSERGQFGAKPSTNLFNVRPAERRSVHHLQRDRSRTRGRGNLSRQLLFGCSPVTRQDHGHVRQHQHAEAGSPWKP